MDIDELPSINLYTGKRYPPRRPRQEGNPLFTLIVIIILIIGVAGLAIFDHFQEPIRKHKALMLEEVQFHMEDDEAYILWDSYSKEPGVLHQRCAPVARESSRPVVASYEISRRRPKSWEKLYACLFKEHGLPTVVRCDHEICYAKRRERVFRFHTNTP
jgi:hypothetical protein